MKGSETMETRLTLVTPQMAREWLERNSDNRPLRPGVVDGFLAAYRRGEWRITHQGIAFAKSGRLLDGQHRLTFISELPDKTVVPMNVSCDLDEDAFDSIDQGFKRTVSDLYGVSAGLVAAARFMMKIALPDRAGITPQLTRPYLDWVTPEYELLFTFCPAAARTWSSAPVRSAAILNMKLGHDRDFVRLAYDALVHSNISAMPPSVRALAQQYMSGKIVSVRGFDLFCRAQRAFNSKDNGINSKIIVKDMAGQIAMNREFILRDMKKTRHMPGESVAKPTQKFSFKKVA
jgi:hypothetical protein